MRNSVKNLVASGIAILLGVAFVTAALVMGASMNQALRDGVAGTIRDASVVIEPAGDGAELTEATVRAVEQAPGVTGVRREVMVWGQYTRQQGRMTALVTTLPPLTEMTTLTAGRLPEASGEAAITPALERDGASVGVEIAIDFPDGEGNIVPRRFRIVGLVKPGYDALSSPGVPALFAPEADVLALPGGGSYERAYATTSTSPDEAKQTLEALPATKGLRVMTAAQAESRALAQLSNGSQGVAALMLGFAALSVFVAVLVVMNTFTILIAQRTRQLALLRVVGAQRSFVLRSVLTEALALGVIASVAGVVVGLGLSHLLVSLAGDTVLAIGRVSVSPLSLLAPVVVGLLMAVVAAWPAARAATRIAPLAALRSGQAPEARAVSSRQVLAGIVIGAVGTVAMLVFVVLGNLILATMAGMVSFVGVLLLLPVIVPGAARLLRPLWRLGGVPGDLAVDNLLRNPRRAASTTAALLVGVTLITLLTVGAASGQRSIEAELDQQFPVDATITLGQDADVARARDAVGKAEGVEASRPVTFAEVDVAVGGSTDRDQKPVWGVTPADLAIARDERLGVGLSDETVVVPTSARISAGSEVTLAGPQGSVTRRAVVPDHATDFYLATPGTLALVGEPQEGLWVRLGDRDAYDTTAALESAVQRVTPEYGVNSVAAGRQEMRQMIDTVLAVAVGLLAVAVVIALVGIGNTLALSVRERRRELSLLRAVGLTRAQMRASVAGEALLVAVVAGLVGAGLGIGYGIAGIHVLAAEASIATRAEIPWLRILLVVGVAVAAGLAASWVPAVSASKVPPAEALAEE